METKLKSASLTLPVSALRDLLSGAVIFTGSAKDNLPALNSVMLKSEGGLLNAAATDRYRLINGWTPAYKAKEGESHEFAPVLISEASVKAILNTLKPIKFGNATLELGEGALIVLTEAGTNTAPLVEATFPPYDHLFNAGEGEPVQEIAFNPNYFADFGKISGKSGGVMVRFNGNKAISIDFNGEVALSGATWRGLLMPQRKAN